MKDDIYDQFVINGTDCNDIVIDGKEATLNDVANYPKITVEYKLKICNYNDYDGASAIAFNDPVKEKNRSGLRFWRNRSGKIREALIGKNNDEIDVTLNKTYTGTVDAITEGTCRKEVGSVLLDTTFAESYMQAKVEGRLLLPEEETVTNKYCYAYAFNPIKLRYDYGDGECKFTVSAYEILFQFHTSIDILSYNILFQ